MNSCLKYWKTGYRRSSDAIFFVKASSCSFASRNSIVICSLTVASFASRLSVLAVGLYFIQLKFKCLLIGEYSFRGYGGGILIKIRNVICNIKFDPD